MGFQVLVGSRSRRFGKPHDPVQRPRLVEDTGLVPGAARDRGSVVRSARRRLRGEWDPQELQGQVGAAAGSRGRHQDARVPRQGVDQRAIQTVPEEVVRGGRVAFERLLQTGDRVVHGRHCERSDAAYERLGASESDRGQHGHCTHPREGCRA